MRVRLALSAVLLAFIPALSAAQPILEMDPCGYAAFQDEAAYQEYRSLASMLNRAEGHIAVVEGWRKTGQAFRERLSSDLFGVWNETYSRVQSSVRSPLLVDVQKALTERCLNRIRETPHRETDVLRADTELMRSLMALSDVEFERQFRARMKAMFDLLGTAHAAGDTLRANLRLATPNWFVHAARPLACPSPAGEHLTRCYPSDDPRTEGR
jgi:hypothetical protein